MTLFELLRWFIAISFLVFGATCLTTANMRSEFARFGLSNSQRIITGVLQLSGAAGILLYVHSGQLALFSAAGLSILMFLGFTVRLRIKDDIYKASPALIYMLLCAMLCYELYKRLY